MVGKAVIRRASGVSLDELQDAYEHGINVSKEDVAAAQGLGKDALKVFFDEALKSHTGKQAAIKDLQRAIAELLEFMRDQDAAKLPLFIFIDELDRCRPGYAIRLLEGVKHLFNVQGVCFVFTTNMTQLAASIKGIYGGEFDGFRYLKRQFSFEYRLPEPSADNFARMLVQDSAMAKWQGRVYSSLPTGGTDQKAADGVAAAFAAIASSFELDLRSQKQVFRLADAVTAQMDSSKILHALYLFALATVAFRQPAVLDGLIAGRDGIKDQLAKLRPVHVQFSHYDHVHSAHRMQRLSVGDLIDLYVDLAPMTFEQAVMHLKENESSRGDFALLRAVLIDDQPWQYNAQSALRFADYPRLVRLAGNLA